MINSGKRLNETLGSSPGKALMETSTAMTGASDNSMSGNPNACMSFNFHFINEEKAYFNLGITCANLGLSSLQLKS